MSTLDEFKRIESMDNNETFNRATDSLEALQAAIAAVLAAVIAIPPSPPPTPLPSLLEDWQLGVDPAIWTLTNPVAGTAWTLTDNNGVVTVQAIPNATRSARMVATLRWPSAIGHSTNKILRRLILEWEMQIGNFANIDEPTFLAGLTGGLADDKSVANVIGFGISAGAYTAYSSNGGNVDETAIVVGAPNTFLKFRLECYGGAAGENKVEYYVNEVLVATHDGTGAPFALPSGLFYPQFYFPAGAGGSVTAIVGGIRIWMKES